MKQMIWSKTMTLLDETTKERIIQREAIGR